MNMITSMSRRSRRVVGRTVRLLLGKYGLQLVRYDDLDWFLTRGSIVFGGKELPLFYHRHNCGWPPCRMAERSVELALVERWLTNGNFSEVTEVGAVTPYYWPGRVSRIIDATDQHPFVNCRLSMMEVDVTGCNVVSISTIEHMGMAEYGLPKQAGLAETALLKLATQARCLLVTVPVGYNAELDEFVFCRWKVPSEIRIRAIVRGFHDNNWREVHTLAEARLPYGGKQHDRGGWANAVVVIERGNVL